MITNDVSVDRCSRTPMASALLLGLGDPGVATGEWDVESQHSAEAMPAFRKGRMSVPAQAF